MRWRVEASAQCRSSRTTTSGRRAAACSRISATASNRRSGSSAPLSAGELGEQAADDPGSRTGPLHQGGVADLLAQLAQCGDDRDVGETIATEGDALAADDPRGVAEAGAERLDDGGLADAGVAAEQDGAAVAGAYDGERLGQFGELSVAADDGDRGGAQRHVAHRAT